MPFRGYANLPGTPKNGSKASTSKGFLPQREVRLHAVRVQGFRH